MIFTTIRTTWSGIFGCSVSYEVERTFLILLSVHLHGRSEEKTRRGAVRKIRSRVGQGLDRDLANLIDIMPSQP
jgi:hypothetical protein